ncbi:MAG: hypothetical protein ACKO43_06335, partial [Alphaproteobacteria bacterium]
MAGAIGLEPTAFGFGVPEKQNSTNIDNTQQHDFKGFIFSILLLPLVKDCAFLPPSVPPVCHGKRVF